MHSPRASGSLSKLKAVLGDLDGRSGWSRLWPRGTSWSWQPSPSRNRVWWTSWATGWLDGSNSNRCETIFGCDGPANTYSHFFYGQSGGPPMARSESMSPKRWLNLFCLIKRANFLSCSLLINRFVCWARSGNYPNAFWLNVWENSSTNWLAACQFGFQNNCSNNRCD